MAQIVVLIKDNYIMESIGLMEPLLPPEGTSELDDLVVDLVSKANSFAGMLNPVVSKSVGSLRYPKI